MTKRTRMITLSCLVALSGCCATKVNLDLTNGAELPQNMAVSVDDSKGLSQQSIDLGRVEPKADVKTTVSVDHGGKVTVKSYLPDSALTDQQSRTVTKNDPDPLDWPVSLGSQMRGVDENKAIELLTSAFSQLGPNVGFQPLSLANALSSTFGSLLLVSLPKSPGDPAVVRWHLGPGSFAPVLATDLVKYPDTLESSSVKVTGSTSGSVAASFAVYGSLGVDSSSQNAYEIDFTMQGFGPVQRPYWDYITGIQNLSQNQKNSLNQALDANPEAVLIYVDRMYVIQHATFSTIEGDKMSTSATLNAASVVTAKGAWTFDSSKAKKSVFNDSVVNISGITLPRPAKSGAGLAALAAAKSSPWRQTLPVISGLALPTDKK